MIFAKCCQYTLRISCGSIILSRSLYVALYVSEINALLHFTQKFKMAAISGRKAIFCEKSSVDSADTPWVKNLLKSLYLAPFSRFHFTQKFKMATKSGVKVIFVKNQLYTLDTLGVKNFHENPLSQTVKEIEANLCFSIFGENSKISKWPSFLGRGKSFENWQ